MTATESCVKWGTPTIGRRGESGYAAARYKEKIS